MAQLLGKSITDSRTVDQCSPVLLDLGFYPREKYHMNTRKYVQYAFAVR